MTRFHISQRTIDAGPKVPKLLMVAGLTTTVRPIVPSANSLTGVPKTCPLTMGLMGWLVDVWALGPSIPNIGAAAPLTGVPKTCPLTSPGMMGWLAGLTDVKPPGSSCQTAGAVNPLTGVLKTCPLTRGVMGLDFEVTPN